MCLPAQAPPFAPPEPSSAAQSQRRQTPETRGTPGGVGERGGDGRRGATWASGGGGARAARPPRCARDRKRVGATARTSRRALKRPRPPDMAAAAWGAIERASGWGCGRLLPVAACALRARECGKGAGGGTERGTVCCCAPQSRMKPPPTPQPAIHPASAQSPPSQHHPGHTQARPQRARWRQRTRPPAAPLASRPVRPQPPQPAHRVSREPAATKEAAWHAGRCWAAAWQQRRAWRREQAAGGWRALQQWTRPSRCVLLWAGCGWCVGCVCVLEAGCAQQWFGRGSGGATQLLTRLQCSAPSTCPPANPHPPSLPPRYCWTPSGQRSSPSAQSTLRGGWVVGREGGWVGGWAERGGEYACKPVPGCAAPLPPPPPPSPPAHTHHSPRPMRARAQV